jgi:hypothetical protein
MYYSYKNMKVSRNRDDEILEICRGKRVLHIGAADSPYTCAKFDSNLLLHKRLSTVTTELLGIDLDADAADWLNHQGLPEIRVMDMNDIASLEFRPQVIVFGETIEHVVNIGTCLATLKSCMNAETLLLISTPNCFHLRFASMVLRNYEDVHDDHKVGFSYGLLHQLLRSQKLKIVDFYFTFLPRSEYPWWRRGWYRVSTFRHGFAETLLAVCRLE